MMYMGIFGEIILKKYALFVMFFFAHITDNFSYIVVRYALISQHSEMNTNHLKSAALLSTFESFINTYIQNK